MSVEDQQVPKTSRWRLSGRTGSTLIFIILTIIAEFFVVLYAMSIGIRDQTLIQVGPLTFSLLFHLIPVIVIVVLAFTWVYLTDSIKQRPRVAVGKREKERPKPTEPKLSKRLITKLHLTNPAAKAALTVLIAFGALILLVSFIAYPGLVYNSTSGAYAGDVSLLGFVKSTAQTFSPIFSPIANALKGAAPAFGAFAVGIGNLFKPVALLDNTSKYLVFQNVAGWILAFIFLLYAAYLRRGYFFRKGRRP